MKKIIPFSLMLLAMSLAGAQTVVTPNINSSTSITNDAFFALPLSTRQIAVNIGNGIVNSCIINGGGSGGYVVNDVLTVQQTGSNDNATCKVTAVSGGSVTALQNAPVVGGTGYHTTDPNYGSEPTTGGSGTGARISVTTTLCTSTCKVNWSVSSTTGGASATFTDATHSAVSSISGGLPTVQVNFGSTGTACTTSPNHGNPAPFTFTCASTVTVQAQSVDDTSKTASFVFNVTANGPSTQANGDNSLLLTPQYQQVYAGEPATLQTSIVGCSQANQAVTWAITTQPAGGNGVLVDTNPADSSVSRDATFTATVHGIYKVTASGTCNSSTAVATIYVSSTALPYAATKNGTKPWPGEVDSTTFSTVYTVGSGKTYADLSQIPYSSGSVAGVEVQVFNTDTTGLSPSTYNNYLMTENTGGTMSAPFMITGVPDSLGNLPVINGGNSSTTQSGASAGIGLLGCGILTFTGTSHNSNWGSGNVGPTNVVIAGLRITNATEASSYVLPSGASSSPCGSAGSPGSGKLYYGADAAGIYFGTGTYFTIIGNEIDNAPNGIFTADNADNSTWATQTLNGYIAGNNIHDYFNYDPAEDNAHAVYLQTFNTVFEGNWVHTPESSGSPIQRGASLKFRGADLIARYNRFETGSAIILDLVDEQDDCNYVKLECYFQAGGAWAGGDQAGVNVVAYWQELFMADFVYGNQLTSTTGYSVQNHFVTDHDGTSIGPAWRNGTLYYYNNSTSTSQVLLDEGLGILGNPYYQPVVQTQNNDLFSTNNCFAMNTFLPFVSNNLTNLFKSGAMVITTPITGGQQSSCLSFGWQSGTNYNPFWPLYTPLDPYTPNLTSGNYLTTSTQPISTTTVIPVSASAAIGAGSALAGLPHQFPVRWQYNQATNALIPRVNALTIGSNDEGTAAVDSSSGVTMQGVTIQ